MALMPLHMTWTEVCIRLMLSIFAGALFGLNRDESGKAAGLRTTLLVCLAACTAMLQVNALLTQTGKAADSFAVLDLMRLPLGILSGVGFIGAGAILRRDGAVKGVTTAATLWIVTVVGLCFGGGQMGIGLISTILGFGILWSLKTVEEWIPRQRSAILTFEYCPPNFSKELFFNSIKLVQCDVTPVSASMNQSSDLCEESFRVRWRGTRDARAMPPMLELAIAAGASSARWSMNP